MSENRESRLESLCKMLDATLKSSEKELPSHLLDAEDILTENREHLSVLHERGVITDIELAAKLNSCFELFLDKATDLLGVERCRSIYDFASGDKIDLAAPPRSASRMRQGKLTIGAPQHAASVLTEVFADAVSATTEGHLALYGREGPHNRFELITASPSTGFPATLKWSDSDGEEIDSLLSLHIPETKLFFPSYFDSALVIYSSPLPLTAETAVQMGPFLIGCYSIFCQEAKARDSGVFQKKYLRFFERSMKELVAPLREGGRGVSQWIRLFSEPRSGLREGFAFTKISLANLINDVIAAHRRQANDLGLQIKWESPLKYPDAECDPGAIAHIIDELLDNAIKYSFRNNPIIVSLSRSSNGSLSQRPVQRIQIRNYGIGIRQDELAEGFRAGYRDRTVRNFRKQGGLGLGLFLSQEIARRHDGRIYIDSSRVETSEKHRPDMPVYMVTVTLELPETQNETPLLPNVTRDTNER